MEFMDMFDTLEKHIMKGAKGQSRSNTLFVSFLAYIKKIVNPELKTYLKEFKDAMGILESGRINPQDKNTYIELINGASRNIKETYSLIEMAWRAYELRVANGMDATDKKYINGIIDKAKITKKNAMVAIDELKKINKKYKI